MRLKGSSLLTNNFRKATTAFAGTNMSTVVAGGSYNMPVYFQGQTDKSTQDLVCAIEMGNKNNVKNVKLESSDLQITNARQSMPNFYSPMNSSSALYVLDVTPVTGTKTNSLTWTVESNSGLSLATDLFRITCYTIFN